jgi:hypothetical protein
MGKRGRNIWSRLALNVLVPMSGGQLFDPSQFLDRFSGTGSRPLNDGVQGALEAAEQC